MMTNLELAKQLLFMIDTESSVQNMVLVNAVARLLDEPDEKAQDETDPEESEQKPEEPERKEAEKKKPKKQIDWGKPHSCIRAMATGERESGITHTSILTIEIAPTIEMKQLLEKAETLAKEKVEARKAETEAAETEAAEAEAAEAGRDE